ncbi:MAG: glucokinase [Burkholderiales bacterium]|nr:glucokinase [Burkholderiales bacterium]
MNLTFPRLVSDIGGTNARFAIEVAPYIYEDIKTYQCNDYKTLAEAITTYLITTSHTDIKHAALAVPSPIVDDTLFMVNSPWHLSSMSQTQKDAKLDSLIFLNDFHALALSIPHIPADGVIKIAGTETNRGKPIAIIGPGTGLGMATLIKHPINEEYFAIPAEGGRSSFVAVSEEEFDLWNFCHRRFHHVSTERMLSGPGLQLIYEAVCSINNIAIENNIPTPNQITERGINNTCFICKQTIDHFCRIFGTFTSNLACITSSFGGIYIGGGIIPQILDYFMQSDFLNRFYDKGRYRSYLEKMPIYVITHKYPAMLGSSYALDTYLNKQYIP